MKINIKNESIDQITRLRKLHYQHKTHHIFKIENDKKHKEKEVIKNKPYQKKICKIKKNIKKKGMWRKYKIKGETLPSLVNTNSRCAKSWKYIGYGKKKPLKEGIKHSIIFNIT